jgi:ribonuclease HI
MERIIPSRRGVVAPRVRMRGLDCDKAAGILISARRLATESERAAVTDLEVLLFADGACRGNPGPGGWAYLLRHVGTNTEKRDAGGERNTTNNRMELRAVIEGLRALKRRTRVRVVTDSQYVAKGMSEWVPKWIRAGWRRGKAEVKNLELWKELVDVCAQHEVEFEHVRGHAGHPENEDCDERAVAAALRAAGGAI